MTKQSRWIDSTTGKRKNVYFDFLLWSVPLNSRNSQTSVVCDSLQKCNFLLSCCVWIQGLHPSEEHLKANYVTMPRKGCSNLKAPPNAPSFSCFWRMHRYNPSWPHISQDSLHAQQEHKEKMASSRGVVGHFRGPGRQKSWHRSKTSGDTTRKCSKG